jgi:methionyl-tRNA synthetase
VFGDDAISTGIPSEVWRYYLLFNRPEQADAVFLWEDFASKNNTELLNNLGNFINRTLSFIYNKCGNVVPQCNALTASDEALLKEISVLKSNYIAQLEKVKIKDGLKSVMSISGRSNQFMQDNKPWELFAADRPRCDTILFLSVQLISTLSVLLEPYMPSLAEKINAQLNQKLLARGALDVNSASSGQFTFQVPSGHILGVPSPLFRKIDDDEIASLRLRFGGAPVQKKKGAAFPLNLVLGTIVDAQDHEGAPHQYVVQIQTDEPAEVATAEKLIRPGFRQVVAQLRPNYEPADLVGRRFAVLTNLKPSNFKGVRSEGMLVTAVKGKTLGLLTVPEGAPVKNGQLVVPRDCVPQSKRLADAKTELKKLDMVTRGETGVVCFGDAPLQVDVGGGVFIDVVGDKAGEGAKIV